MKKTIRTTALLGLSLALLGACTSPSEPTPTPDAGPVVENFSAEYEMTGTTSAGKPKNDTFIFEGTTEDGIIKTLNFDIIRNKGLEGEYSKKDIMGYMMNVCDATVTETEGGWKLEHLDVYGYEEKFDLSQFMVYATLEDLTEDSTFADLTITSYTGEVLTSPSPPRLRSLSCWPSAGFTRTGLSRPAATGSPLPASTEAAATANRSTPLWTTSSPTT